MAAVENNYFCAIDYSEATDECKQWAVEDSDSVEDSEASGDS